ncbi:MAG: Gfo/Idh/MocA family oxidoreductase, partial [Planctomycetes bacterium]|nr:Gfo/Idh/MocA family oxidoreductase [Planctomycetota bacterium]
MAIKIGQVGLGFMGKMHFDTYARLSNAQVVAICDSDVKKRRGDWSDIAGNIAGKAQAPDLSGVTTYSKFDAMLKNPEIEVVDITLPTFLHEEFTLKALQAGK